MEELRTIAHLEEIDERHILLGQVSGRIVEKYKLHAAISSVELNSSVPEQIRSQFNVARNMALYSYYCYSFAPEVQSKTFTIIEFALKLREGSGERQMLRKLLYKAVSEGWISDQGFRHLSNTACKTARTVLASAAPSMRTTTSQGDLDAAIAASRFRSRLRHVSNRHRHQRGLD